MGGGGDWRAPSEHVYRLGSAQSFPVDLRREKFIEKSLLVLLLLFSALGHWRRVGRKFSSCCLWSVAWRRVGVEALEKGGRAGVTPSSRTGLAGLCPGER